MNQVDRWSQLCALMREVAPGVEAVGAYSNDGKLLTLVGSDDEITPLATRIRDIAERIGASSPTEGRRPMNLPRATFMVGRRKLLMRSLAGNTGYAFSLGDADSVTSNTWLLLDAVAILGGALQSHTRPQESKEKN